MGFHICDQGRYSVLQLLILIVRTCAFQILFPKFSLYKKTARHRKRWASFHRVDSSWSLSQLLWPCADRQRASLGQMRGAVSVKSNFWSICDSLEPLLQETELTATVEPQILYDLENNKHELLLLCKLTAAVKNSTHCLSLFLYLNILQFC